MNKQILVLGAGRVVKPMIDYFFGHTNYLVTVAGLEIAENLNFISKHPQGKLLSLDIENKSLLQESIKSHDIVISLLPATLHYRIACMCLDFGKNLITASYVTPDMQSLNEQAQNKGLLFLNEIGLDPGIDHILAKYMIDLAQQQGGKVISFLSYCGGLPAPESNDNPVGYKFSWSPLAVMRASKNEARFLHNSEEVMLDSINVFRQKKQISIQEMPFFAYANRDSLKYKKLYNLKDIQNIMRCTLRHKGWCEFVEALLLLGFLSDAPTFDTTDMSAAMFTSKMFGQQNSSEIYSEIKNRITNLSAMSSLEWLGIFDEKILLPSKHISPIDFIVELSLRKMSYKPQEKDMIVLHNSIEVKYPQEIKNMEITLVDFEQNNDSAMARTVSLPVAIATELILENKISQTGVQIPIFSSIYLPMIEKLKQLGMQFYEKL
ncbi:saccharopine dehydrogenase C-terminal domain-containing protein [Candidatus Uabimicrobium sp. HlEnr_7]|uniref:saccharopine dehydrogenase C-terminal domain-containing protein n=1 Tax=Candidatus Uabimicrobium helgolandensis TaxID=3095367 RepID=UPI0035575453